MTEVVARQPKGLERRREIIAAAAEIIREEGPAAVSHRTVAARAGCSLSATTYYFSGLEELLSEAGKLNINRWAERAESVALEIERNDPPSSRAEAIEAILRACLPRDVPLANHYQSLLAVWNTQPVTAAYHAGRKRLDSALERVLRRVGCDLPPALVVAVVDGAAVTAISESTDVLETARRIVGMLISSSWVPVAAHGAGGAD